MEGTEANFSAILNFRKARATIPLRVKILLKLNSVEVSTTRGTTALVYCLINSSLQYIQVLYTGLSKTTKLILLDSLLQEVEWPSCGIPTPSEP